MKLYQIPSLKVLKKIKILTSYFWLKIFKKIFQSWLMRATSLSCMDIQLHFLKIFILKIVSKALARLAKIFCYNFI